MLAPRRRAHRGEHVSPPASYVASTGRPCGVRCPAVGEDPVMEREKGEYLEMDEDKSRQLDQQAQEYVDDAPALPSMNADPGRDDPDPDLGTAAPDATQRVES